MLGLVFGEKYQQLFLLMYIFNTKSCVGCYALLSESNSKKGAWLSRICILESN